MTGDALRWDPQQYLRYDDERSRPFGELVARIGAEAPETVVDLGCGPGTTTAQLLQRWPDARVTGVDSSPEMVAEARSLAGDRLGFVEADLRSWAPEQPVDVILSNATLQWVPGHLDLLGRLVGFLRPGGWLAFQVPGNFAAPSHAALHALARSPRWRDRVWHLLREDPVHEPEVYLAELRSLGCQPDVWETTYLHVLHGTDPVYEWTRGTALRPVLSALETDVAESFADEYRRALRRAYPEAGTVTVFPFRRIFAVGRRGADGSDRSGPPQG